MNNKFAVYMVGIAIIVAVVGFGIGRSIVPTPNLGSLVHNALESFDSGIAVNGTSVIDSSRQISGTNGTFSGTLTVTGETNVDTLVQGGTVTTLSATSTQTLAVADLCDSSIINFDAGGAATNLTVPTSTSLIADCIPANGDKKSVLLRNTGADASSTIVAGSGITLLKSAGGAVAFGNHDDMVLTLINLDGTNVKVLANVYTP